MGKQTYFVNGKYYMVDEETGEARRAIVQDDPNIPNEDLKQLVAILAGALANKNGKGQKN
jgi:hypothetical protein